MKRSQNFYQGFINGGFMVSDKRLLNEIDEYVMLERDPMIKLVKRRGCFLHS